MSLFLQGSRFKYQVCFGLMQWYFMRIGHLAPLFGCYKREGPNPKWWSSYSRARRCLLWLTGLRGSDGFCEEERSSRGRWWCHQGLVIPSFYCSEGSWFRWLVWNREGAYFKDGNSRGDSFPCSLLISLLGKLLWMASVKDDRYSACAWILLLFRDRDPSVTKPRLQQADRPLDLWAKGCPHTSTDSTVSLC